MDEEETDTGSLRWSWARLLRLVYISAPAIGGAGATQCALSSEMERQVDGTVEAGDLSHTAGHEEKYTGPGHAPMTGRIVSSTVHKWLSY
jgi:hypothetical protein